MSKFPRITVLLLMGIALLGNSCAKRSPQGEADVVDLPQGGRGRSSPAQPADRAVAGSESTQLSPELGAMLTERARDRVQEMNEQLDPRNDGWESEVVNQLATGQLKKLAKLLTHPEKIRDAELAGVFARDFRCGHLRPLKQETVHAQPLVTVLRGHNDADERTAGVFQQAAGFKDALVALAQPLHGLQSVHAHVKTIHVEMDPATVKTRSLIQVDGHNEERSTQWKATWTCGWTREDQQLRLTSLEASDFEEVTTPSARWFSDCTEAVMGSTSCFRDQLQYGLGHWLGQVERIQGMDIYLRYGMAAGDANGDGRDDIYVCQPGGLPNRLLVQNQDGTVTDISAEAGVDWLDHTTSALFLDLANDGDQDLVQASSARLLVMDNQGKGKFQLKKKVSVPFDVQSLSAADYDADGDLDLYITVGHANGVVPAGEVANEFVYHDANNGGSNVMLQNDIEPGGDWRLVDVTKSCGLDVDNRRHSLAASWEDYDNDGDLDLYVANDYGRNCFYQNDGGIFTNIAQKAKVKDLGSGMSVSWGDFNRDGRMDVYVANMFSSAGSRVTRQQQFKADADDRQREIYRRLAKGNSLFEGRGDGTFREVGKEMGVEIARWAWSSLFVDLDNDSWEDLVVANGFITNEQSDDL